MRIWDADTGKLKREIDFGQRRFALCGLTRDGTTFVTLTRRLHIEDRRADNELTTWDTSTWRVKSAADWTNTLSTTGEHMAVTPDGNTIVLVDYEGTIRFRDVASGKELPISTEGKYPVTSLAFSPDGKLLALASQGRQNRSAGHLPMGLAFGQSAAPAAGEVRAPADCPVLAEWEILGDRLRRQTRPSLGRPVETESASTSKRQAGTTEDPILTFSPTENCWLSPSTWPATSTRRTAVRSISSTWKPAAWSIVSIRAVGRPTASPFRATRACWRPWAHSRRSDFGECPRDVAQRAIQGTRPGLL